MNKTIPVSTLLAISLLATITTQADVGSGNHETFKDADAITQRQCDSLHPLLSDPANAREYFSFDGASPDIATARKLQRLYKKLEGKWEGRQVDQVCLGTGENARQEHRYYSLQRVRAAFRHDGLFTFRSDKHRIEKPERNSSLQYVSMKPDARLDFYPADELQHIEILDDNTIVMTKRYRQANTRDIHALATDAPLINNTTLPANISCIQATGLPGDGTASETVVSTCERDNSVRHTTTRERIDTLMLDGNLLYIQTLYYTNGYFSGTESMQLKRAH